MTVPKTSSCGASSSSRMNEVWSRRRGVLLLWRIHNAFRAVPPRRIRSRCGKQNFIRAHGVNRGKDFGRRRCYLERMASPTCQVASNRRVL